MIRMANRWTKACATSSHARLLAAYGEIGLTAGASSRNGAGVASPYTDEEEARTGRQVRDQAAPRQRHGVLDDVGLHEAERGVRAAGGEIPLLDRPRVEG